MINLDQKIEILRMYFTEGKAKKQIAKELQVSKNTVKKYINEFEESQKELIASGVSKYELIEKMIGEPKYNASNRSSKVMTEEVKEKVKA